ncbi:MAG: hypothetical protein GY776_08825 [Alteromonas sp.]|nr:hypothetical protein [Alteromonas sp.]
MNNLKVAVQFRGNNKEYIYNTTHKNHEVGDMVVVESPHDGLVVVAVSRLEITRGEARLATKWIVALVDVAAHEQRLANDLRKAELKASITQRVKEKHARKIITEALGADDAELKELEALERGELDYMIGEVVS